jgi:hypothetical protein
MCIRVANIIAIVSVMMPSFKLCIQVAVFIVCQTTNQGASLPVSVPLCHQKLLDSVFNLLLVFICQWEIQTYWVNAFLTRWRCVCG